jgi:hypothetical protein
VTAGLNTLLLDALTADPGSPVNGQLWFNATEGVFKQRVGGVSTALAAGVFGNGFEYTESLPVQTETGTVYDQKFRYTTPVLAAGDYFVLQMAELATSNQNRNGNVRYQEDDVDVYEETDIFNTEFEPRVYFARRTLSAAAHNFDWEIRKDPGVGQAATISIKMMRLAYWRVS